MKEQIVKASLEVIVGRIKEVEREIGKLNDALEMETKSSMGDKYETGREMLMQEKNKLFSNLELLIAQRVKLENIDSGKHYKIRHGSYVQTNLSHYLIAISYGAIHVADTQVYLLSENAPVAKKMMGKEVGDSFEFNNASQTIVSIE